MNTQAFFKSVRSTLFGGKLTQGQVDSLNAILFECKANDICDQRHIAYILATPYHEVGKDLQPVREGFAKTNQGAIQAVTNLYKRGIISVNYAKPKPNGHSYYGRGFVQLTWDFNYKNAGDKLGIDLYNNPDMALQPVIAAKILVKGMIEGWFTGKKLSDYFNEAKTDWVGARRIINGTDKAEKIAVHAIDFHRALTQ